MKEKLLKFTNRWAKISRLNQCISILNWDLETYMPEQGINARSEQIAMLSELAHQWLVDEETYKSIEDAEIEMRREEHDYFSDETSMLRIAKRVYEKEVKIPEDLVARFARETAKANSIWIQARKESNFDLFAPALSEIIMLCQEKADKLGYKNHIYDALLDIYEPEMTTAEVEKLFNEMKSGLIPFINKIKTNIKPVKADFLKQIFDPAKQKSFSLTVLHAMGYDFKRGRLDESAHPFTTSFTPYDVRITTRFNEKNIFSALFGSIHEGGHALYDQGLPLQLLDTPICESISLGVHESQSRLWENIVGRSKGFWKYYLPLLKKEFLGQLDSVELNEFYQAINRVKPSLIRVEADEVTYNMHIFIRFEIEQQLLSGSLKVKDIPELWNSKYNQYLGITPPNDAAGCLQDIHWAHGAIGYFPTYSIGNLLSAQIYDQAVKDNPGIPAQIENGDFSALLGWLRTNIHNHGARYTTAEIVKKITGSEIRTEPYLTYLVNKYTELLEEV